MGCICSKKEKDHDAVHLVRGSLAEYKEEAFHAAAILAQGNTVTSRVELSISAQNLKDTGFTSKSDPFCVISLQEGGSNTPFNEIGRTEIISNSLNPDWVKRMFIYYKFEEVQVIKFDVYAMDQSFQTSSADKVDLRKQHHLGSVQSYLGQIIRSSGVWGGSLVVGGYQRGIIQVKSEEVARSNTNIEMRIRVTDIKSGTFGTPSPFIKISKLREDGHYAAVYRSEVKKDNTHPAFSDINGTGVQLANGDVYRPLRVELFSYKKSGNHKFIGYCDTCLNQLADLSTSKSRLEMHSLRKSDTVATLFCDTFKATPKPTFVEYIKGGTELSFMVAVDFTASNLEAGLPNSLHYINPNQNILNPYATAISSLGHILEYYDSNKKYPLYGFGGKPDPGQPAQHCFALNFNEGAPAVDGIYGVLNTYYDSLRKVIMSGPTLLAQVISQASAIAASYPQTQTQQVYHVLLIITDGVINDMDQTIDAILKAAHLPLSIIIVGVGNADFRDMHILDGDEKRLQNKNGQKAVRDIVQFCNMQEFRGLTGEAYKQACARKVLEELPMQLTQYYTRNNIVPNHHVRQVADDLPPPPPSYEQVVQNS